MSVSRDSVHKRRKTGGRQVALRKKRLFESARQAASTKIGEKRVRLVRTRGGNRKYRALRLETGNFSWASEGVARKSRIIGVVYNATNNELVRTNTLVKNAIIQIDATPFKQWYESYYGLPLGRKKNAVIEDDPLEKKVSKHVAAKRKSRQANAKVDPHVADQFTAGRVYACISSRPGQSGRCDGYILEGRELDFYLRKMRTKKGK
eukprot:Clim_evm17s66 gene=Clim_evmTU17s66